MDDPVRSDTMRLGILDGVEYISDAGALCTVLTATRTDLEVPLLSVGYGFVPADGQEAETLMLAIDADVNARVALATLPRNVQHHWQPGTGGIQSPVTPDRRIGFEAEDTWLTDGRYRFGPNGEVVLEIDGQNVKLSTQGTLTIAAAGGVEIQGPSLMHDGVNIGNTHVHGGVTPGGATTGVPQ